MFTDVQNTLMNGALSTAAPATFLGQFTYDLWGGQASLPQDAIGNTINIDPGTGRPCEVVIEVTAAVTSSAGASVQFILSMSDDQAQATNLTSIQFGAVWPKANLVQGFQDRLVIPFNLTRRFLGFQYAVSTTALTAGSVAVYVVMDSNSSLPQQ